MRYRLKFRQRHNYEVDGCPVLFVDDSEKIERVQRMLDDAWKVGIDTEYYGYKQNKEHPYGRAKMTSLQFSCKGRKLEGVHEARYIFVPNWGEYEGTYRHFRRFFEDSTRKKVFHNYKADAHVLANRGIVMRGLLSDTQVKCYLENSAKSHGLKEQMDIEFGIDSPSYNEAFKIPALKKNGEPGKRMVIVPPNELIEGKHDWYFGGKKGAGIKALVEYAVKDPFFTLKLDARKNKQLRNIQWYRDKSMLDYYLEFDNDFLECLFEMERLGCVLSKGYLLEIREKMVARATELEQEFFHLLVKMGVSPRKLENLSMSQNTQLAKIFAEDLGMDLPRTKPSRKFPQGQPSVSADALQNVKKPKFRPLINVLEEWRSLHEKLLGTYVDPFLQLSREGDGRLRTQFKYPGPVTGRLSSSTPNLQNIPRVGEDQADPYGIRKAFVAPDKDFCVGDADLSQIEIRLMAHFTNDENLVKAILNGWDIHALTAVMCFKEVQDFVGNKKTSSALLKSVKEQFPDQRQSSKTINFMIGYGGGPQRYADLNNVNISEGKRVINAYWEGYPGMRRGIDRVRAYCREHGYIKTLLGRRIYVPDINSYDKALRGAAERKAFNYVIQGSAAELLKMSMVLIYRDGEMRDWGVKLALQIHDELVFYVPNSHKKRTKKKVDAYMSYPYRFFGMKDLRVPTPGEIGYGDTWEDAKNAA